MMILHGVDVYLNTSDLPKLPSSIEGMDLIFIASRGTRVFPVATVSTIEIAWPQCRFFSEKPITDKHIEAAVSKISELGYQWTKCQKLFKIDGENAFSQPY